MLVLVLTRGRFDCAYPGRSQPRFIVELSPKTYSNPCRSRHVAGNGTPHPDRPSARRDGSDGHRCRHRISDYRKLVGQEVRELDFGEAIFSPGILLARSTQMFKHFGKVEPTAVRPNSAAQLSPVLHRQLCRLHNFMSINSQPLGI